MYNIENAWRNRENNVSLGRVCNILGTSEQNMRAPVRKESVSALCAKISQENLRDDIGNTTGNERKGSWDGSKIQSGHGWENNVDGKPTS